MANKRKHVADANANLNSNRRRAAYAVNEVNSALFWNARTGDEAAMHLLLANGATMAVTDESGCPVLIIAAMHGNEGAMCLLLEKGAAVEARDKVGMTA
jgi:ankyrin repeat protein